jgi:hypothetical protein
MAHKNLPGAPSFKAYWETKEPLTPKAQRAKWSASRRFLTECKLERWIPKRRKHIIPGPKRIYTFLELQEQEFNKMYC